MTFSHANFTFALVGACRTIAIATFLFVSSASVLGFAVSVHMAQVFERVSTLHATALPVGAVRLAARSNSL